MSDTPIYDKLSEEFRISKAYWKRTGAKEELEFVLVMLKDLKKPSKAVLDVVSEIEKRLEQLK